MTCPSHGALGISPEVLSDRIEALTDVLWAVDGVQAVEAVYRGTLDQPVVEAIKVFLDPLPTDPSGEGQIEEIEAILRRDERFQGFRVLQHRQVQDEDWSESWKAHWQVSRITHNLVIRPSWEPYDAQAGECVITLDPGRAFGTGTHETTCLMLRAMADLAGQRDFSQCAVLDVGCGSGILAIYAAKLGSRQVQALDIDPQAITPARANMTLNAVESAVTVTDTPLAELCQTRYEVILANILGETIRELLPEMVLRQEPGGVLLASGLIAASVNAVREAMAAQGYEDIEERQDGEWFLLQGTYQP